MPFFPIDILGFNLTGWAWILMLLITCLNLLFIRNVEFPLKFWLPWILYLIAYLVIDFSFLGLQLTLQYILPLLIGIVASGFLYDVEEIKWLFKWFFRLTVSVYLMFLFGYFFRGGYTPASAATPMLLSITFSFIAGLWFLLKGKKFLFYVGILFLQPVLEVSRMGIVAMASIFILHFANQKLGSKLLYSLIGLIALLLVFNSRSFQEKTFFGGSGSFKDLTLNYYENTSINNNGRISWKKALQPGLEAAPIWGNGPRADYKELIVVSGMKTGEAHNDYMSVRYNYGYVGLGLLLFGFIFSFISIFRISRKSTDDDYLWLLTVVTLTLFIGFFLFMYSDNILKYTIYFPNYFFALIGIIYSVYNTKVDYSESY